MPIPSTTRKPGVYVGFDVTSSARGLAPIDRNVAVVGAKLAAGTATVAQPVRVYTEGEADSLFGTGSEMALMCRAAFAQIDAMGKGPAVYGCPIADAAGTAAVNRFAISGTATEAGNIVVKINGVTISAGIANGDAAAACATALQAKITEYYNQIPVTAAVATSTNVDLTCVHLSVLGNDYTHETVSTPAGISIVDSQTVAGVGAYDISAALAALVDIHYHAVAIGNHTSVDTGDFDTHYLTVNAAAAKKWTMGYMAENGSLSTATTLAGTADTKETVVITAEDFPQLPGMLAAALAVTCEGEEDVALGFNDVEMPGIILPAPASNPTDAEIETALAGGCTPFAANRKRTASKIVKAVTTQVTDGTNPFFAVADISVVRTLFMTGIQLDIRWSRDFNRAKKSAQTIARVKSATIDVLKQMEENEWLQNVDNYAGQISVETDGTVVTRLNVEVPASVISPLHQLDGNLVLFLE